MLRVISPITSTSVLALARLTAQQLGQRIRVLATDATPARWVVGDLIAQDDDSLRLRVAGQAQPIAIARRSLQRLEIARRQRATWAGAGTGFGLGFLVGPSRSWTDSRRTRVLGSSAAGVRWTGRYT